jgi:uncharacterized membrane protein YqaE (UPF0057 family)
VDENRKTPKWLILLIVIIASIEPLTHLWIAHGQHGENAVSTGLHISDSSIFIHCMNMFPTDFYSPYASVQSPHGDHSSAFLPSPFHWLYAIAGQIGYLLHIEVFLFLGLINGLISALYFWVVWKLLQFVVPKIAPLAFVLFLVPGNLGGVMYLVSMAAGWTLQPDFDDWFERISMYTLVEGSYLGGWQHMPRMYYTLSLALCYGSLREWLIARSIQCNRHLFFACLLLFAGSLINIRIGGFTLFVFGLYLWTQQWTGWKHVFRPLLPLAAGWGLAALCFALMAIRQPVFMQNTTVLVQEGMWTSSFIFTLLLILPLFVPAVWVVAHSSPMHVQRIMGGLIGYLALFLLLFTLHRLYYGNWFRAGDSHAAVVMSDWALIGVLPGILGVRLSKSNSIPKEQPLNTWLVLWILSFAVLALSAFGQGWFLKFTPQRLMMMMGLPLAIITAQCLWNLKESYPTVSKGYSGSLVVTGLISLIVGTAYFQGPLNRVPGDGPFAKLHREVITQADAYLLYRLPEGRVLTPNAFADVVALRPGNSVIGGIGGTDLSDLKSTEIDPEIRRFFSGDMDEESRSGFLTKWQIDFVFCPDTWPIARNTLLELYETGGLQELHTSMRGVVFKVH